MSNSVVLDFPQNLSPHSNAPSEGAFWLMPGEAGENTNILFWRKDQDPFSDEPQELEIEEFVINPRKTLLVIGIRSTAKGRRLLSAFCMELVTSGTARLMHSISHDAMTQTLGTLAAVQEVLFQTRYYVHEDAFSRGNNFAERFNTSIDRDFILL